MPHSLKKKLLNLQIKMAQEIEKPPAALMAKNDKKFIFSDENDRLIFNKNFIPNLKKSDSSPRFNILERSVLQAYLLRQKNGVIVPNKEFGKRILKTIVNKIRLKQCQSLDISPPDPNYKVVYLGNVLTGFAKGENCVDKPLNTLWRNYTQSSRADIRMQLTVSGSGGGLRATTNDHGLTEYWANRISFCAAPSTFPRLFCWIYRHEGRRLRHELRCHAVLCSSASMARKLCTQLKASIQQALMEFKRDKISRQNARLALVNACYDNPSMPRRKILLSTGSQNYRPPLERSKSAPKLTMIEENLIEEESDHDVLNNNVTIRSVPPSLRRLKHSDSTSVLLDKNIKRSPFCKNSLLNRLPSLTSPIVEQNDSETESNQRLFYRACSIRRKHADLVEETEEQIEDCNRSQEEILEVLVNETLLNEQNEWILEASSDEGSSISSGENHPTLCTSQSVLEFKIGESVLERVRNLEGPVSTSLDQLNGEGISIVPNGDSLAPDFNSLRIFKKKNSLTNEEDVICKEDSKEDDLEKLSVCSDESGYGELIETPSFKQKDSLVKKIEVVA